MYGSTTATIYAEDLAYHPNGALSAADFGNGTTESLTLNSRFRPNHLVSGPLDVTYTYDGAGNVSAVDDARSGYDSSFSYDYLDRLTGVTGFGATAFSYDAQGNRLTKGSGGTGVSYTYSSTTNRLTSASSSLGAPEAGTFGYDDVGNLTSFYNASSGVNVTNTYTARNMMRTSVDGSNPLTRYQYDAAGMRALKSGPGGQSYYIHGPGGMLLAEYAGSFSKESPWAGTTGLSPDVTLEWATLPSATYELCVDVVDDDACTTSWTSMSSATATTLSDLAAGTYFWQVRATTTGGTTYADANNWWSFTVNAEGVFGKTGPGAGSTVMTDDVTLTWNALPDVGWSVCWDTTDNDSCDGSWLPNGAATSRVLEGLSAGTYYWQVRAWDGTNTTYADAGVWWSFVKVTGASGKLSPQTGVSGLSDDLWLSWAAAGDVAYYVCWDTTNNNTCDGSWNSNGGSTTRLLQDLSPGTYYWQVKVWDGGSYTEMNSGAWWHFTVGAASGGGPGSGTSSVTREYIYLGSKLLASVESGTTTTWYHTDVLGSVRAVTNSSGSTVTRHDYFPFGESTSSLSGDPRRFLGQELDAETAFDHLGARQYRNVWGRFTSVDPIFSSGAKANPQLWNRYAYSLNGPLRFSDPTGLEPDEPTDKSGYLPEVDGVNWVDPEQVAFYQSFSALLGPTSAESDGQSPQTTVTTSTTEAPLIDRTLKVGSDFFAGAGDCLTGRCFFLGKSGTEALRRAFGTDDIVTKSSRTYQAGAWFGTGTLAGISALGGARAAFGLNSRIGLHGAHHTFKALGSQRLPHIQINFWLDGVKGSGFRPIRIPLPNIWPFSKF